MIDLCELATLGYFEGGSVPSSAWYDNGSTDNCSNGSCDCPNEGGSATGHYKWYWAKTDEQVVSLCTGSGCTATDADGYQDVFP
ncbi:MAG: hypothetical protein SVP26_03070 [Chloroflexota bacterium]|nr:hypothetical protein [Chloroflexota bacterium]